MIAISSYFYIIITNFLESKKFEIILKYDENMKKIVYELMNKNIDKHMDNYNNTKYIYNSTYNSY